MEVIELENVLLFIFIGDRDYISDITKPEFLGLQCTPALDNARCSHPTHSIYFVHLLRMQQEMLEYAGLDSNTKKLSGG